ncbi:MAG: FimV/HubP family polar landmark protein [Pseudomonadota bacterium]
MGRLTVQSSLGQPLRAEIELLSVSKDELSGITAKVASAEAFRQARMDRTEALGNLRFAVDQRANGQPVLRISSTSSLSDPFLDLLIELNWSSGRLIREYTILLDPPTDGKAAETPKAPVLPEAGRNGESKPAPAPAASQEPRPTETQPAKPAVSTPPAPSRYGPVKSGETLRGIAGKVKSDEVTLEQMMVSLFQANKGAFYEGNMNRLKKGQVLSVPEAKTAIVTPPREAARTVQGHYEQWHAYRRKVAEMADTLPPAADQAAGKITPKAQDKAAPPPAVAQDVLKLSKGEPGAAGKADAKTQERLRAMEEEVAAKSRALQEAQDRVGQLERTVRDMQKLLEMKAQEAAKAPPAPTPAPAPVTPPPVVAQPPVAEPPVAEPPAPAPEVKKPTVSPAPAKLPEKEAESPSWISTFFQNPLYIGGVVVAVLLSGLLWMMMVGSRRRQGLTKFEDSVMTGGEFKPTGSVFTSPAGTTAPAPGATTEGSMLLTDFSRLGMGAIDSHEVDPIAEAEVYMAYGRDAQAEEILKEALGKDPSRHEIALKLLEIYASRKDTMAFETTASELYAGLGGQNTPVWQRAAEMGRSIDPDNPLYRVAPSVGGMAPAMAAAAAAVVAPAPVAEPVSAPEPVQDQGLEFPTSLDAGWGDEAPVAPPAKEEPAYNLDDTLIFERNPAFAEAAAHGIPPVPEPEPAPVSAEPMEMTLPDTGLDMLEPFPADNSLEMPAADVAEAVAQEADDLDGGMDFDLPAPRPEPESVAVPELDLTGIDLDLETPSLEPVEPAEVEFAPDLDFAPEAPAEVVPAALEEIPIAPMEETMAETPASEDIDPELREEVNTKLDLAKAYLEMGDREGAREILQEVLNEGDGGQKAEANRLLAEAG